MDDLAEVREAFIDPQEFWSSPLYQRLCPVVATDPFLVSLAANRRAGQGPTFAFFGAVHFLLLSGVVHPLGEYYLSLQGESVRLPDDEAGIALTSFAHIHAAAIQRLLETRLVQTNHVQRAFGLRLGLVAIAEQVGGAPVHLLEIGSSAGLVLRHDRYGYRLGDHRFGDRGSPVQLVSEWRTTQAVPDLDAVALTASSAGIDLNPLDPSNETDRLWLEAFVWPEDQHKAALLRGALALAQQSPIRTLAGDAIDLCPQWIAALPAGEPRVVFHCATRMHVPVSRRPAFDSAIESAGNDGPLYRIAIEGNGLTITGPRGSTIKHYDVDGHLAWIEPS